MMMMMSSSPEVYHSSCWKGLDMFWPKLALLVWSPALGFNMSLISPTPRFWGSLCGRQTGDKWIAENLIFDVMWMRQPWCQRILFDFLENFFVCNTSQVRVDGGPYKNGVRSTSHTWRNIETTSNNWTTVDFCLLASSSFPTWLNIIYIWSLGWISAWDSLLYCDNLVTESKWPKFLSFKGVVNTFFWASHQASFLHDFWSVCWMNFAT